MIIYIPSLNHSKKWTCAGHYTPAHVHFLDVFRPKLKVADPAQRGVGREILVIYGIGSILPENLMEEIPDANNPAY